MGYIVELTCRVEALSMISLLNFNDTTVFSC